MMNFYFCLACFTDRGISLDEFIRIRKDEFFKRFESQISDDDIEAAKLRFRLIDTDKSGYIDWIEYLNYECMRRMWKRPAVIEYHVNRCFV